MFSQFRHHVVEHGAALQEPLSSAGTKYMHEVDKFCRSGIGAGTPSPSSDRVDPASSAIWLGCRLCS